MKIKSNVKAGGAFNHNQTAARGPEVKSDAKIRTKTIGFFATLVCALGIPAVAMMAVAAPDPDKAKMRVGVHKPEWDPRVRPTGGPIGTGGINHNQTVVRAVKVKSRIKAGLLPAV